MRIEQVTADAFGPLQDETIELSPGLTVVFGINESAKSSWHAAIYAALCGVRRGRGQRRAAERDFDDQRRPWVGDKWQTHARARLDSGTRVEIGQDLAGKVDCHAIDLDLGRDLSAEIIHEGTPDGSKWLGLDRTSFLTTACVEQAQVLRVLDEADGLQEHLQRAAAAGGADATAAAALERINRFKRENVGTRRANSTKPLQRAVEAQEHAEHTLEKANRDHAQYLDRVERYHKLRADADEQRQRVREYEAAEASAQADTLETKAQRASELRGLYGDTPPASARDDEAVSHQVSAALEGWRTMPPPIAEVEPSSGDLQAQIDELPEQPKGDTEAAPAVDSAYREFTRMTDRLNHHEDVRPVNDVQVPDVAADDTELRELAHTLGDRADTPTDNSHSVEAGRKPRWLLSVAGALIAAAGIAMITASRVVGTVFISVGLVTTAVAWLAQRIQDGSKPMRSHADSLARARQQAVERCAELGLEPDPAWLHRIITLRSQSSALADREAHWEQKQDELTNDVTRAVDGLAQVLIARGVELSDYAPAAIEARYNEYVEACKRRREQAQQASRRSDLIQLRDAAKTKETRADQDRQVRQEALDRLHDAATTIGVDTTDPDEAASGLNDWIEQRNSDIHEREQARRDWDELTRLLAGSTIHELQQQAREARTRANDQADGLDPDILSEIDPASAGECLPNLRKQAADADAEAQRVGGEVRQYAQTITSVTEAEEQFGRAKAELDHLEQLEATLDHTHKFLNDAQQRVHRSIAPTLATTLREWLPKLTANRYTDVIVNPETLTVLVAGPSGSWRKADQLSHGTAEQVYLLLRLALVAHLTQGYDTCPLLLDDITVNADPEREREILDMLLEVADTRQIILFTQEERIAEWLQEHITDSQHSLVKLTPGPVT